MKKSELIDKLFNEFDKDKKVIKKNLLEVMNTVILEAKDKEMSISMVINVSRKDEK